MNPVQICPPPPNPFSDKNLRINFHEWKILHFKWHLIEMNHSTEASIYNKFIPFQVMAYRRLGGKLFLEPRIYPTQDALWRP